MHFTISYYNSYFRNQLFFLGSCYFLRYIYIQNTYILFNVSRAFISIFLYIIKQHLYIIIFIFIKYILVQKNCSWNHVTQKWLVFVYIYIFSLIALYTIFTSWCALNYRNVFFSKLLLQNTNVRLDNTVAMFFKKPLICLGRAMVSICHNIYIRFHKILVRILISIAIHTKYKTRKTRAFRC